jgi:hypothetical protein
MKEKIKKIIKEKGNDKIKGINETNQKIRHKLPKVINDSNSNIGKIKGSKWT